MWELDHKEGWALKNWCFQAVVLEKTPESLLDSKEIKPVNEINGNLVWNSMLNGNGRTDIEAEAPILWPPNAKNQLNGKDTDAGHQFEGRRKRGRQRMRWLDGISNSMYMSWVSSRSWWWTGRPSVLQSMGSPRVGQDWATELNWTDLLEGDRTRGAERKATLYHHTI